MSPQEKFGLDGWVAWAFAGPWWLPPFMEGILVLGALLGATVLIEGRMPKLREQYTGVWPGDLFLAIGYGLLTCGGMYFSPPVVHGFWQHWLYDLVSYVLSAAAVLVLAVPEYARAYQYRNAVRKPADVLTFRQLHSPSCLAHRIITFIIAYLLLHVGVPAPKIMNSGAAGYLTLGGGLALMGWVFCAGVIDNGLMGTNRPRPDLSKVHPLDGGWFGSVTRVVDLLVGETTTNRYR